MVSVWIAEVSPSVAVCDPGVLVTLVTLVKLSVPSDVPALSVPAFDPVRLSAVPAGLLVLIVKVLDLPDVPLNVSTLVLTLVVMMFTVVDAAPAKVV